MSRGARSAVSRRCVPVWVRPPDASEEARMSDDVRDFYDQIDGRHDLATLLGGLGVQLVPAGLLVGGQGILTGCGVDGAVLGLDLVEPSAHDLDVGHVTSFRIG